MSCSNKCRHEPFIKFVHGFQVHVAGQPHVFIDEIQGCMGDELVQVAMIVLQSINSTLHSLLISETADINGQDL